MIREVRCPYCGEVVLVKEGRTVIKWTECEHTYTMKITSRKLAREIRYDDDVLDVAKLKDGGYIAIVLLD